MTFLYPLGLLGLIGVPILILIYIIKNKYTEQTISSTYIWTYSERFLKKRKRLPKIAGLISLILQLLAIVIISVAIAHPVLIFPNAAYEYCFIIDASGSMNIQNGSNTRFEIGKDKIQQLIEDSVDGGVYTLICVGDTSTNVVFEREDSKKKALEKLQEISVSYGSADTTDALMTAQGYFNENPAAKTFFITDHDYVRHDNVQIINVAGSEENYALSGAGYTIKNGVLTATVSVLSHLNDAQLDIQLFVDDSETPVMTNKESVTANEALTSIFEVELGDFRMLRFVIANADSLALDNEITVYNAVSENAYTTLIVSQTPFFFQSVMEAVGNSKVATITPEKYEQALSGMDTSLPATGYSLYVFDSYTPPAMPVDGSVWLINQSKNMSESGFSVQGEVLLDEAVPLELTTSTSSVTQKLINNVRGEDVYVFKYIKYGIYSNFTTLYSYNKQPLIFAGTNSIGNREVVFAFSLHDSNFPLLADFIPVMKNLITYSFPNVIEKVNYTCGDTLEINVPSNCTDIKVETPMGNTEYPVSGIAANELILDEPGVYTITLTVGETLRKYRVYCEMPAGESDALTSEHDFSLQGEAGEGGRDGVYDDLIIFMAFLAVFITVDWMVYCYDKYQLR